MISFRCSYQWDEDERDDWDGFVEEIAYDDGVCEVCITGRGSRIRLMLGKSTLGVFACVPDYDAGCYISSLDDLYSNSDRLIRAMENIVDATTVACGLRALKGILEF